MKVETIYAILFGGFFFWLWGYSDDTKTPEGKELKEKKQNFSFKFTMIVLAGVLLYGIYISLNSTPQIL